CHAIFNIVIEGISQRERRDVSVGIAFRQRRVGSGRVEDGVKQAAGGEIRRDAFAARETFGIVDDQRDVNQFLMGVEAVSEEVVLPVTFAMIGDDDNGSVGKGTGFL